MIGLASWFRSVGRDVALAVRTFRKSPLFTATAIATLTLSIAANTTIFSVTKAVLLDALPFRQIRDPKSLVMVWETSPKMASFIAQRMPVRLKDVRSWTAATTPFSDMAAWSEDAVNLSGNGKRPDRVAAASVSANLFSLLGISPRLGHSFDRANDQAARKVVLLSDQLWRSRFGGDARVLGKTMQVGGAPYQIVGVLPPAFELPAMWGGFEQKKILLWMHLDMSPASPVADQNNLFVYARLRPGWTIESARSAMNALQHRLAAQDKALTFFSGVNVSSIEDEDVGPELRRSIWIMQAAVAFVLMIACANVANLSLTRAISREKEFAVRLAMGATRMRVLRLLLTESVVLSLVAATLGVVVAYWGIRLVNQLAPKDTHGFHEIGLDATVLVYTAGISLIAGVLFGLAPYLQIRKHDLSDMINRTSRSIAGSSGRLRAVLITAELALSVVLLIGAGLMIRTLSVLMSTQLGFDRSQLLSVHLTLPSDRYPDHDRLERFNRDLLESAQRIDGVRSVMLTSAIPMQTFVQASYRLSGTTAKPDDAPVAAWARVSAGYFQTLRMHLISGRTLQSGDRGSGESAAVVNRAFALANAANGDILGRTIEFAGEDGKPAHFRIIGVVGDERQLGPDNTSAAEFYLPGHAMNNLYLIVRVSGDPLRYVSAIETAVSKVDQDLPVGDSNSFDAILWDWTAPRRFVMSVLVCFALVAMVLAAIGLFGVLAYSVGLRTREIGVRLALGGQPNRIARGVFMDGLKLTVAGIAIGIVASLALVRFLASLIYGVAGTDLPTFTAVPAILSVVALLACYAPAKRAASVDPVEALRVE